MNDIPLIQNVDKNSINTSIIAIKKQLNQISELLGLIDIPDAPDHSPFVRKDEVADVIEADNMNPVTSNAVAVSKAMPVNEVTSGNMYSVTSNAVAQKLSSLSNVFYIGGVTGFDYDQFTSFRFSNVCVLSGRITGSNIGNGTVFMNLPSGYRPKKYLYVNGVCESSSAKYPCVFGISDGGGINVYHNGSGVNGLFISVAFETD